MEDNRTWRRGHVLAAITVAATLSLAACRGGSGGPSNARGTTSPESMSSQMLPFARCMRTHGVPNFPDPTSDVKFPDARALGISESTFHAALIACEHLLPNGGNAPNQAELQRQESALLPFAECMRSNGVPDWPDPSIDTNPDGITAVAFNLRGTSADGAAFDSPKVQAAVQHCSPLLPPSNGGPPFHILRGAH